MAESLLPKIALFGNHGSTQVEAVRQAVVEQGGQPLVFDIQLGGARSNTLLMGEGRASWNGVDFSDIHAVHIRCTAPNTLPAVPPVMNAASYAEWRTRYLREQEYSASAMSFFDYLDGLGKLVINPLTRGYIDHDSKGQLYENLRANGFPAPLTITTNDPQAADAFVERLGEVVVKPAIGVGSTRLVDREARSRLDSVRLAPVMMQQRIRGNTVRVHVVGDQVVLALRIISEGGVDSRTETKRFEFLELPPEEAARIAAATRFLGLHYAAWDIIEADDGSGFYYLDCNPGPYVMWIGPEFVRVVFRQLANYLITFARSRSLAAAAASVVPWRPGG